MLILPEKEMKDQHEAAKQGLTNHFNSEMEKVINANSSLDRYWILGKVRFPDEFNGKVGRVFLEASQSKPHLVKEAFLYEVDNRTGTKTLLWVMHPDDSLSLPTLKKTISVKTNPRKGRQLIV